MKSIKLLAFILLFVFTSLGYAVNPLPKNLIEWTNPSASHLLKENLNGNLVKLLAHFTTQKTVTFCGIASSVMILNASNISPPLDKQHAPYQYFNQDDFFNDKIKKIIHPQEVLQKGVTISELSQAIEIYGLHTKPYFANELNLKMFRQILKDALINQKFIILNFLRTGLNQVGGGHHSPIAAYDKKTDRFLVLDVARYKYPAYWAKTEDLWKAANTKDGDQYRGFIIIHS